MKLSISEVTLKFCSAESVELADALRKGLFALGVQYSGEGHCTCDSCAALRRLLHAFESVPPNVRTLPDDLTRGFKGDIQAG